MRLEKATLKTGYPARLFAAKGAWAATALLALMGCSSAGSNPSTIRDAEALIDSAADAPIQDGGPALNGPDMGGPCTYQTVHGTVTIASVTAPPVAATACANRSIVAFVFMTDDGVPVPADVFGTPVGNGTLDCPPGLEAGATYPETVTYETAGTCDPVLGSSDGGANPLASCLSSVLCIP